MVAAVVVFDTRAKNAPALGYFWWPGSQHPRANNRSDERDVISGRLGPPGSIQHNSWPPDAIKMRPSILLLSQASLRRTFLSRPQLKSSSFMLQSSPIKFLYTTMSSDMSSPLIFTNTSFEIIDPSEKLEEETIPLYNPENYYPAHIGQVLVDRYQIVGKLGYGVTSTVWFGRDLQESRYVSLKICTASSRRNNEIDIYKQLDSVASKTDHVGQTLYRQLYDSFEIIAPHGTSHTCLVHQPLGLSMSQVVDLHRSRLLSTDVLKPVLRQLLVGLDFLHVADVVHTGKALSWNFVSSRYLFPARISEDWDIYEPDRIAEMVAIMGPPPKEFLKRSDVCNIFWDEDGRWKDTCPIPNITLDSLAKDIKGDDRDGFLTFLGKILRWLPEERPTAGELVYDEWLMKGLGEKNG
ncbi:protein kinase [Histoplasma capsulatum var. duboisii H88]|uniref:non-specific serine/threonine protein kinase n=1 Tax=Ajellomyces capsulatus (strain H88) TaxID=544711 RepID=F0UJ33_AJEC8|nr:protein kinase [Histoplasma capsulatum var. duboisii H88]